MQSFEMQRIPARHAALLKAARVTKCLLVTGSASSFTTEAETGASFFFDSEVFFFNLSPPDGRGIF